MKALTKICETCDGEGSVSHCCGGPMDDNKCSWCGKFASADFCCPGEDEFRVGDEVDFFVCVYNKNDTDLHKKLFKKHKLVNFSPDFSQKTSVFVNTAIRELIPPNKVRAKVDGIRNLQIIDIEHLELR